MALAPIVALEFLGGKAATGQPAWKRRETGIQPSGC